MSDGKLFGKAKALELRAELEQALKKLKPHARVKVVLRKIISNIILNTSDLAAMTKDVVPLMAIDDIEIRKLVLHHVVAYAAVAKDASAVEYYVRFSSDHNPILRALAVKTVCSVNSPKYVDAGFTLCKRLLTDKVAHVRTTAAFSVARLFQFDPERASQMGLVDDVNELLYDESPTVVAHALAALSSITELAKTLNLAIDKNHLLLLVRSLAGASEWRLVYVLNALTSFVPQTSEDALLLLEQTLPALLHSNLAVVLNAVKVIVYFSNYVRTPELVVPSLARRIGLSLVSLLGRPAEIQFLVLRNVILLLLGKRYLLDVDVEQFFWQFDDPICVKDTKLEIIYLLANEQNAPVVFLELEEYATEVDVSMARKAVRAFGNLAVKLEAQAEECVNILEELVEAGMPYIVQEATVVFKNVVRRYPGRFDHVVDHIVKHYKLMEEPEAKAATCWIVGQYSENIGRAEEVLDYFVAGFTEEPLEVQHAVLAAVVKYYLKDQIKGERLLLKVLRWATEDSDNPDVRDRGFFYWRLITDGDLERTLKIVINLDPLIGAENDIVDPAILEELELNIGTLVSIYLKSVEHVFRLAKRKQLPLSPALQERRKNIPPPETSHKESHKHKPLPPIRLRSSGSTLSVSSKTDAEDRRMSFGKKLSRKASQLAVRRGLKY